MTSSTVLKRTPFYEMHRAAGAKLVDFAGYEMPVRYTGDVGIPALSDVLTRYRDVRIIVEMKVDSAEMGEAVARVVRAAGAADRVCVAGYGARSAVGMGSLPGNIAVEIEVIFEIAG